MKKAVAFILAAIVMSGCVFCGNAADENKITVPVTDAVFAAEKLSLEKNSWRWVQRASPILFFLPIIP